MNLYEEQLLKLGLENYKKNGSSYSEIKFRNGQEWIDLTNSATYLHENNWLIPHSDNILADSVSVVPNDNLLCFELTNEGLSKAKALETT